MGTTDKTLGHVFQDFRSENGRLSFFRFKRELEMTRETCPNTQLWLLLSGSWSEKSESRRYEVIPHALAVYEPKQPCTRVAESEGIAMSLEYFSYCKTTVALQSRHLYKLAIEARKGQLDSLVLEEHLEEIFQPTGIGPGSKPPAWLVAARDLIHTAYDRELNLTEIAQRVGISANHLSASFPQFYGLPMSKYVRRLRAQHALRLGQTVPNPWLYAGFYDASHYYRACLDEFGLTPKQIAGLGRIS